MGGTGSLGSTGPNYGIGFDNGFSPRASASIDRDAGGAGNFANEPSPSTIMIIPYHTSAVVDRFAGFSTGFSFWYSSGAFSGNVSVYDGLNANGNLLGSIQLPALGTNCVGDPGGAFCNWAIGLVTFAGVARSIKFSGTASQIGFDNLTFGATAPVPEPSSAALLGLGLTGWAGLLWRRRGRRAAAG